MKMCLIIAVIVLWANAGTWADEAPATLPAATRPTATGPAVIYTTTEQIFKAIPAGVLPAKGSKWTELKAESANAAIAEKIQGQQAKLKLVVEEIPHWDGWLLYAHADLPQGFPVRVFAHFKDEDKAKFAALNKGDVVVVTGTFNGKTKIENLWNQWGLSVNLDNSDVSKSK